MAPTYKFTYFNLMGLGEPVRFLLHYGGLDFEDVRVSFEEWPAMKPTIQFGQLPILEVDGKKMNQSQAIARYLGKLLKISGANDWESAEIDAIVDTTQDMRTKMSSYFYSNDSEEVKQKMLETIKNETLPYYLTKFDEIAKAGDNYFVGGKLSWADIFFVGLVEYLTARLKFDLIEKYPSLMAMRDHVRALPGIKQYIEKRPKTDF